MVKTKLVATVGPACDHEPVLSQLITAGVDIFRLNFSHGDLSTHGQTLSRVREAAARQGVPVAVMGDLQGPKVRLGKIADGRCELRAGQELIIQREDVLGTAERVSSTYPALVDDVAVGDRVLIDDGNVLLHVIDKRPGEIVCRVDVGGVISNHKGINLPDSTITAPSLTEKDLADLQWAMQHDVDFIALSFVRHAREVKELRDILEKHGSHAKIVVKIEKPQAIQHIESIVEEADVVLIARGDLGVEMDVARVPLLQKEIALLSRNAGKPVIVATQMLQSMVEAPTPTRAEVSDVANAILDGTDAVMLSAETAVGKYPVEAVRMIERIAAEAERFRQRFQDALDLKQRESLAVAGAVVRGASIVSAELNTRLVVVWTQTGTTARLLSRHRLGRPIVALTPDERISRQMTPLYGVIPIVMERHPDPQSMVRDVDRLLLERKLAYPGDRIAIVSATHGTQLGETDLLLIHVIGGSPAAA